MILLDGKSTSEKILTQLKTELEKHQKKPTLDIILVGEDPYSQKYTEMKQKQASEIGIGGNLHKLPQNSSTEDVVNLINSLNYNPEVTALMVQLPLPPQINTHLVLESINPQKDADGLTATNLGLLFHNDPCAIASATALGIIKLIDEYNIDVSGKNAVIIGRSPEVGMPLFALLQAKNSTVTICHSKTKNLTEICQQADILVSAIGKPKFINKDFIKTGNIVIDVGYSTDPQTNKVTGDIDFDTVAQLTSYITPVPGGVGPMTIVSLLSNTVEIWKRQN